MKNSVVRGLFCLALIFSVCLLNACSRHNRGAEDILYEICASLSLPAGQTYLAHTEEGGEHYLSSDTAQSLYGAESVENTFPLIEDYAIYISSFLLFYVSRHSSSLMFKCCVVFLVKRHLCIDLGFN